MTQRLLWLGLVLLTILLPTSLSLNSERSVLAQKVVGVTPTPSKYIIIKLIVPGGIPVQNSAPKLIIGNKIFEHHGGGVYEIQFTLTPADFASINNGDSVLMSFDRTYMFGPLDKNNLTMREQLKLEKQAALDGLIGMRKTVTNTQDAAKLDTAIQLLTDSLASSRWVDNLHLQPSQGLAVFDADIQAVTSLQQVTDANLAVDLSRVMRDIVYVDRNLAAVAHDDAATAGGPQSFLDKIGPTFTQGYNDTRNKAYANAIASYRDAWQLAQKAIAVIPTQTPITSSH